MPIDLYYMPPSPPCRSVLMTAKMIGLHLNLKMIDLTAKEHLKPEFVAINPQTTIPTIDDNGFYLCESRAICTYFVQKYAKSKSLYPKDEQRRALIDQRLYFDAGVFYQSFSNYYYPVMFRGETQLDEKVFQELQKAIGFLELFLSNSKYAAGDNLTVADICLVASAATMKAVNENIFLQYPNIQRWMHACKEEIANYQEINEEGANIFGQIGNAMLNKLTK